MAALVLATAITVFGVGMITTITTAAVYADSDDEKKGGGIGGGEGEGWPKTVIYAPESDPNHRVVSICQSPEYCKEIVDNPSPNNISKKVCEEINPDVKCVKIKEE